MTEIEERRLTEIIRLRALTLEMLAALKEVDRLYSTVNADKKGYGLIANHSDCGRMIGAVRDAIDHAEAP